MNISNFPIALGLVAGAMLVGVSPAREFEDRFGRIIDAELVEHTGVTAETVTISKAGKKLDAKISLFSDKDQQFIRDWMKKTPPTLEYAFRIGVTTKEVAEAVAPAPEPAPAPEGDPFGGRRGFQWEESGDPMAYQLTITNLTRHTVSGLRVEYRAYELDHSGSFGDLRDAFRGRGGRGFGGRGGGADAKPKVKYVEGSNEIEGELRFNQNASIETKPLRIGSGKKPFSDDSYKDEMIGVIVRVFEPGGKMVFEHRDTKTKDCVWELREDAGEFGVSFP